MATQFFRTCADKALAALISGSQLEPKLQQQVRRKQRQQLQAAVQELLVSSKPEAAVSELVRLAQKLHDQSEYVLALQLCCHKGSEVLQTSTNDNRALRAEVEFAAARSTAAVLAKNDPELRLSDTVNELVLSLSRLEAAMHSILPYEQHRWLLLHGVLTLQWISRIFVCAPGRDMLQFLAFACLALEQDISFSSPEYLPVRIDMYLATAQCKQNASMLAEALKTIERGQAAVAEIEKLEQLDPLPPPPAAQAAYAQAKTRLNLAHFALSGPGLASEQAVRDSLRSMFASEPDRLAALTASLQPVMPDRVLTHHACPASHTKLLTLVETLVKPHVQAFTSAAAAAEQPTEGVAAAPLSHAQEAASEMLPVPVHQVLQMHSLRSESLSNPQLYIKCNMHPRPLRRSDAKFCADALLPAHHCKCSYHYGTCMYACIKSH